MNNSIKILNLSKTYMNCVQAVNNISLDIRQGEFCLISGPNGSGKTTLLSLIAGLVKPSSGRIILNGTTITKLNQKELTDFRLNNIGFIFQSFRLLNALTAKENIRLILDLKKEKGNYTERKTQQLLFELGITHRADFYPDVLSGGEKQRVAIARALANDPKIILADEPTGSLDSASGQATLELLSSAAKERKITVIVVSHDQRIEHFADRMLRMEDGCLK